MATDDVSRPDADAGSSSTAVLLLDSDTADRLTLSRLQSDPQTEVIESLAVMIEQLKRLHPPPSPAELGELPRWVFYPWRRTLISVLGPASFRRLRLDRNRNKISSAEQAKLSCLKIGVVGLSVGHAIAHTLAPEGLCGAGALQGAEWSP